MAKTPPPQLSLAEYRALFAGTSRPTETQVLNYIDHACEMHSWYKHLPLVPPGQGFQLLLDPQSGRKWVSEGDGPRMAAEIKQGDELWHYSMMPTATYRQRFGHLQLRMDDALGLDINDPAHGGALRAVLPPPEILEAGRVTLTAVVHRHARSEWLWMNHFNFAEEDGFPESTFSWPEESGGPRIVHAIRNLLDDSDDAIAKAGSRYPIEELIAPERQRQLQAIRQAIDAMLDVVYGPLGEL